jgi:hypothetical protein
MWDRILQLKQQIDIYRGFLREGTFARQTDIYLRRIMEAEEELRRLTASEQAKPE